MYGGVVRLLASLSAGPKCARYACKCFIEHTMAKGHADPQANPNQRPMC